ncbi:MAG: putative zinc-binding protein [Rhodospirillales bacterium]|nr:putative zinc-binding protein [Rhodospirillales bacterium]
MTTSQQTCGCSCSDGPKLIFPCSGAADVGALADQAARHLSRGGVGNMFCLAGIGGRVPGMIKGAEAASAVLAIDGCPIECARKTLEQAGIADILHVKLAELGFKKGQSPVTDEALARIAAKGAELLGGGAASCCAAE